MRLTPGRARLLVMAVALLAYANSLGNGFAFDDQWFIVANPVVTEGRFGEAFTHAAWPGAEEGTGNYRPVALVSFALEWAAWNDGTLGFHLVSIAAHAAVCLLVLALLARFVSLPAALVGGLFFAVHPVHTEAVANVMGRSELYAAIAYLGACLVYDGWRPTRAARRGLRLLLLVGLYLLAVGSKEIAVTLPAVLVAIELFRRSDGDDLPRRLVEQAPTYVALAGVLGIYVLVRWSVLGDVTGESATAMLFSLTPRERVLTALTVWLQYLRLMVFPLDLVMDYGPAVLTPALGLSPAVVAGSAVLLASLVAIVALRSTAPVIALGLAWFVIAVSPVSNLLVRADILLAERTLYLPSVGAALVVAAMAERVLRAEPARWRRVAAAAAAVAGVLLAARTIQRNPAWDSTYTALSSLTRSHPESWVSQRTYGISFRGAGDLEASAEHYEVAVRLAPDHYGLLVEAAELYADMGRVVRSEQLLREAIRLRPGHWKAYEALASARLRRGEGRAAHAAALEGLARVGPHAGLLALVSESYVAKGDLEAALRARRAAVAHDSTSAAGWSRLAELLDAIGRPAEALGARGRAAALGDRDGDDARDEETG